MRRPSAGGISVSTILMIIALILGIVALLGYNALFMLALAVIALALAMLI